MKTSTDLPMAASTSVPLRERIRKAVRRLADQPLVGRLVRVGVATWRGPQTRDMVMQEFQDLATLRRFVNEQVPTLLEAISHLNHQQTIVSRDESNLAISVPVALRGMRRELNRLQQVQAWDPATTAARLDAIEAQLGSKEEAWAPRLNAIQEELDGMRNALKQSHETVDYLVGRVEFVRRELMYEMRHGGSSPSAEGDTLEVEPKVVNGDKLTAARQGQLRLNLGCGHIPLEGYLNVDRRDLAGVDIVSEVSNLPLERGEVDEIFSSHMLEHFPQEQLRRELLPYWKSLLKPGGKLAAVVPDAEAMIREYGAGRYDYDDMREVMYGAQDYDGDFHFNMFTPSHLGRLLQEAGFADIEVHAAGRRNGKCFEFEISARNPG